MVFRHLFVYEKNAKQKKKKRQGGKEKKKKKNTKRRKKKRSYGNCHHLNVFITLLDCRTHFVGVFSEGGYSSIDDGSCLVQKKKKKNYFFPKIGIIEFKKKKKNTLKAP